MVAAVLIPPRGSNRGTGPHGKTVQIEVAGFVFRVVGATEPSLTWIKERYRPFLCQKPSHFCLQMEIRRDWPAGRPPQPRVEWREGSFHITLPGCRAHGSVAGQRIRLAVPAGSTGLSPSFLRCLCSLLLLREGGFLLHASGVVQDRHAWVFCGPSEAGKTTIARLAGTRQVLNDETVAILRRGRGYVACATPFFGEGGPVMATENTRARAQGMFFLHKARQFAHRQLTASEAVVRAFPQVFLPKKDPAVVAGILEALAEFAGRVPCYDLFFRPDATLWEYLDGIA